jgi:protocatechuate 3,4-dioxygenase beta subunit
MKPYTNKTDDLHSRRRFLARLGVGAAALTAAGWFVPGVFAEELARTPPLTEGPFYPDKLPLDQDNDLIIVGDSTTPAVGEITHLTGRVLDINGNPIKDAEVEIWQCDGNAVYLNTRDSGSKKAQQDRNFQGYGKFQTASDGGYRFRTIKPVPYPGRPAGHIHFKVNKGGRELLTSQIFVAGAPGNMRDGVFLGNRDPVDRELVQTDFVPVKDSKIGELQARFDIVIGRTPADRPTRRA